MEFNIKNFFSKCDQIRSFVQIWSHLLKKSLMENFIFCAVITKVMNKDSSTTSGNIYLFKLKKNSPKQCLKPVQG